MSGSEKPGYGQAIEALPKQTGSKRIGLAYRRGARVRLYRRNSGCRGAGTEELPEAARS